MGNFQIGLEGQVNPEIQAWSTEYFGEIKLLKALEILSHRLIVIVK